MAFSSHVLPPGPARVTLTPHDLRISHLVVDDLPFRIVQGAAEWGADPETAVRQMLAAGAEVLIPGADEHLGGLALRLRAPGVLEAVEQIRDDAERLLAVLSEEGAQRPDGRDAR